MDNTIQQYRYTQCGLDNINVSGIAMVNEDGEQYIHIPCINQLHDLITLELFLKPSNLNGKELYFLRGELGLSISKVSENMGSKEQILQDWEQNDKVSVEVNEQFKSMFCKLKIEELEDSTIDEKDLILQWKKVQSEPDNHRKAPSSSVDSDAVTISYDKQKLLYTVVSKAA